MLVQGPHLENHWLKETPAAKSPTARGRSCWRGTCPADAHVAPQDWRGERGGALPLPSAWLLSFPAPGCPCRPQKQRFPPMIPPPSLPSPIQEAAFKQVLGHGGWGVQTHQRTRVERRQVRVERGAPHGPRGGGQAGDFERGPSRVPPTAPCLDAVSVPALMCHVSGRGFPGAAARSPANLSLRQSGSLLPELCHALPPQPPSVAFGENQGQTGWSPGQPLLVLEVSTSTGPRPLSPHAGAMRQPAGQVPCHKGQNQCVAPVWTFLLLPAPRPGVEPLACNLVGAAPVPTGQPLVWTLKPWLSLGTSLNFSGPGFLPCDDRSLRGFITRPRPQGPWRPWVTLG